MEDDDKVEVCLRGLKPACKSFKTSIQTQENIPNFLHFILMLIIEEKNLSEESASQPKESSEQVFYSIKGRGRGRGGRGQRGGRGRNYYQSQKQDQEFYDSQWSTRGRGNSQGKGSQRGYKKYQENNLDANSSGCWSSGKPDHFERECPWKNQGNRRQQNTYASTSNQSDSDRLFVMQHMMNSMSIDVSTCGDNVWYVDSGASII